VRARHAWAAFRSQLAALLFFLCHYEDAFGQAMLVRIQDFILLVRVCARFYHPK